MKAISDIAPVLVFVTFAKGKTTTEYPHSFHTGKLNQFVGFVTPSPLPPPTDGPFVYDSVWASWSAWSFCVNNVQVRVRACNTVRGFSCLGSNQEFMECNDKSMQSSLHASEYEVVDPWEEDRKEAMKQLYPDNYTDDNNDTDDYGQKTEQMTKVNAKSKKSSNSRYVSRHNKTKSNLHSSISGMLQMAKPTIYPSNVVVEKELEELDDALKMMSTLKYSDRSTSTTTIIPINLSPLPSVFITSRPHHKKLILISKNDLKPSNLHESSKNALRMAGAVSKENQKFKVPFALSPPTVSASVEETTPTNLNDEKVLEIVVPTENSWHTNVVVKPVIVSAETVNGTMNASPTSTAVGSVLDKFNEKYPLVKIMGTQGSDSEDKHFGYSIEGDVEKTNSDPPERIPQATLHSGEVEVLSVTPIQLFEKNETDENRDKVLNMLLSTISEATVASRSIFGGKKLDNKTHEFRRQESRPVGINSDRSIESAPQQMKSSGGGFHPRAFGQKTVIEGKSEFDPNTLKNLERTTTWPRSALEIDDKDLLFRQNQNEETLKEVIPVDDDSKMDEMRQEIQELKETMKAMKAVIDTKDANEKAMNLNLVPMGPQRTSYATTPPVVIDSSRLLVMAGIKHAPAKWTEWSDWQNCFCGKQIRTRVCQYDDPYLTKGCSGKSYESRPCDDMENCPTTRPYSLKYATKVPYLPSTRRQEQPFKSNFLSIAVKKTDTIVEPVTA